MEDGPNKAKLKAKLSKKQAVAEVQRRVTWMRAVGAEMLRYC